MRFGCRGSRLAAVSSALTAALSLTASSATASDTFVLDNDSKTASLLGTSLWGKGNTMDAGCRTGPFPGPTETAFTFEPGDSGAITLSRDPFSDCLPGINPLIDNSIESPTINSGDWIWIPVDPLVGDAHLTCAVLAQNGSRLLETNVDGLTCTFSDGDASTAGSFGSSAAPLRHGKAVAYVQHFPGSGLGAMEKANRSSRSRGRYAVALHTDEGRFLGRKQVTLSAGKPRPVRVPVTRAVRRQVSKQDFARVEAVIRRADGKRGSGDRATLTVIRDSADVPF